VASAQSKHRRLPDRDLTSCKQAGGNGTSISLLVSYSSSELDISPSDDDPLLLAFEPKEVLLTLGRLFSLSLLSEGGWVVVVLLLATLRIDSNSADACDSKSAVLSSFIFVGVVARLRDEDNDNLRGAADNDVVVDDDEDEKDEEDEEIYDDDWTPSC
jgi:hypothetical protein